MSIHRNIIFLFLSIFALSACSSGGSATSDEAPPTEMDQQAVEVDDSAEDIETTVMRIMDAGTQVELWSVELHCACSPQATLPEECVEQSIGTEADRQEFLACVEGGLDVEAYGAPQEGDEQIFACLGDVLEGFLSCAEDVRATHGDSCSAEAESAFNACDDDAEVAVTQCVSVEGSEAAAFEEVGRVFSWLEGAVGQAIDAGSCEPGSWW